MSLSSPMTSKPDSISARTASEPISPPDPVTIAVAMGSIVAFPRAIVRRTQHQARESTHDQGHRVAVQAAPTRSAPPAALEPDEELEVRLESELPARLAIGTGNAVFVYGSCFHRRRRVVKLWLLAGDRRVRPIAF